jgi:hypothetical protein
MPCSLLIEVFWLTTLRNNPEDHNLFISYFLFYMPACGLDKRTMGGSRVTVHMSNLRNYLADFDEILNGEGKSQKLQK